MSRAVLILSGKAERDRAIQWICNAPVNTRVEFKRAKRSLDQNSRMWAMLTEIAEQLEWQGVKYTADDWKDYFMHALKKARWMPAEDGGMVPIGMHTSDLSKDEHSDLMEIITEFGARNGVVFREREAA